MHVHSAPDIVTRKFDDADLVAMYRGAGYDGFVVKCHNEPTASRTALMRKLTGFPVYGSVVLNRAVGGINPAAVAAQLELGARVVWMPTEDSRIHRSSELPRGLSGKHLVSHEHGIAIPPVDAASAPVVGELLDLVAEADAVLATGHLSVRECAWLMTEARRRGMTRVVLTHPSYTVPGLTPRDVEELVALGAKAEITAFQLILQPDMTASRLAQIARSAGNHLILTSDAGNPAMPNPPEAIEQLIDALAKEGIDRGILKAAASTIPKELVVP